MSSSAAIYGFLLIGIIWALVLYFVFRGKYSYRSRLIPITMVLAIVLCVVGYFGVGFLHSMETSESCGNCHAMAPWYHGTEGDELTGGEPRVSYLEPGENKMMAAHSLHEGHPVTCSNCHAGPGVTGLLGGVIGGVLESIYEMLGTYEIPIHGHYPDEQCNKCHDELNGHFESYHLSPARIKERGLECRECHKPHEVGSGLEGCNECHSDIPNTLHHQSNMDCLRCHEDHSEEIDCTSCHKSEMVKSTCSKCHTEEGKTIKTQMHKALECDSCHIDEHPGKDTKSCVECHPDAHYKTTGCMMCHADPHAPLN
ncbi:MAG: hypothetical protein SVY15_00625 [Halobacteriota archaeon]|nr:hypothetical protein [Halobacteriota archaeon]